MPEYGRLVQKLVELAVSISDRKERQQCAEDIVRIMANCSPQNRNIPGFRHKLWDHLAIISDYKLDIDYPYPVNEHPKDIHPEKVPYPENKIRYRHYGHLIESLLKDISQMPEGEERNELTRLAEEQMRKNLAQWNKGTLDDKKIQKDIDRYLSTDDN